MTARILVHCLCNDIQFKLRGEPRALYASHFTDYQRRSMGALRPPIWVERQALHITDGVPDVRISVLSSGRPRIGKVCLRCESDLWTETPENPKLAVLRRGTLQMYNELAPVAHLLVRSALPWITIPAARVRHQLR